MSACGAVSQTHEVEFNALEGSLNMMSKVLNDVLDLCVNLNDGSLCCLLTGCYSHRMDSGKFESFNKVRCLPSVVALRSSSLTAPSPTFFIKSWNRFLHLYGWILTHAN